MNLKVRAAAAAAVTFCAGVTFAFSSPGLARELDHPPVNTTTNAQQAAVVPPPTPGVLPAYLTPETTDADQADQIADTDDSVDYDSLADAVAAQHSASDMDDELRCLATGIYFESKGEPLAGQLAVADVILNRTKSSRFPRSVCSVLTQPHQFSFVRNGRLPKVNTRSHAWRTAVAVAKVARQDLWDSPMSGALYFHARYVTPGWRMAKLGTIGNHIFYR